MDIISKIFKKPWKMKIAIILMYFLCFIIIVSCTVDTNCQPKISEYISYACFLAHQDDDLLVLTSYFKIINTLVLHL